MNLKDYFDNIADSYRQRDVWAWLRKREKKIIRGMLPKAKDGGRTLEIATGSGFYTNLLMEKGHTQLTCVDLSPKMLKQIPFEGVEKISGDFITTEIPGVYDLIVCCGGIEFMTSMQEFFMKCRKLSKPGTQLVILVPLLGPWSWLYQMHYLRKGIMIKLFDPKYLQWLAQSCGWKIEEHTSLMGFTFAARFRYH
jgi:ubiquinone/menaquinone biosynthesis C-methylase UbiE